MIKFKNVNITFNKSTALEKKALQNINLQIGRGDFVTVIGGNGAGKSTLLNALCGDVACDRGKILVDGKDVTSWRTWQRSRYVARVFQDPMAGTCPNLTIEENMAIAYKRGKKRTLKVALKDELRDIFRMHLARLGLKLENRLSDPMGSLSGGQRQAISLLMAALTPMKILALDEHTAALDPRTAEFVIDLTKRIVEENKLTVLMVTHSMHQALYVGNRTLMLYDGKVVYDIRGDKRKELKTQDLLDLFETYHKEGKADELLI